MYLAATVLESIVLVYIICWQNIGPAHAGPGGPAPMPMVQCDVLNPHSKKAREQHSSIANGIC